MDIDKCGDGQKKEDEGWVKLGKGEGEPRHL